MPLRKDEEVHGEAKKREEEVEHKNKRRGRGMGGRRNRDVILYVTRRWRQVEKKRWRRWEGRARAIEK